MSIRPLALYSTGKLWGDIGDSFGWRAVLMYLRVFIHRRLRPRLVRSVAPRKSWVPSHAVVATVPEASIATCLLCFSIEEAVL